MDERFADWVDGRLKPSERAALEAEMASDPALKHAAEEYRRGVQLLRSALAPPDLELGIAGAVMARVGDAAVPPRRWRPYLASALAAVALVLVFVTLRLIPSSAEPTSETLARAPREERGLPEPRLGEWREDLAGVRRAEELAEGAASAAPMSPPPGEPSYRAGGQPPVGVLQKAGDGEVAAREERETTAKEATPSLERADEQVRRQAGEDAGVERKLFLADAMRDLPADTRSELDFGEVALVVDVPAAQVRALWTELDQRAARAPTSGAEVLAMLAPATGSAADDAGGVDLRRVRVTAIPDGMLAAALAPAPAAPAPVRRKEGDDAGSKGENRRAVGAGKDAAGPAPPPLQLRPGDRAFFVTGSLAELRVFASALQARMAADRARVAFARYDVEAAKGAAPAARARPAAPAAPDANKTASGDDRYLGARTAAPPERRVVEEPGLELDAVRAADRLEIMLVLRAAEGGR